VTIAVAALVVFLGLRLAAGELPADDPGPTAPAWLPTPDPDAQSGVPLVAVIQPSQGGSDPAGMVIQGERLAFDAVVLFSKIQQIGAQPGQTGTFWVVQYDSNPNDEELSYLFLDLQGRITRRSILPGDETIMQQVMDAAPTSSSPVLTIAGTEIVLTSGMRYVEEPQEPGAKRVWIVSYEAIPRHDENSYAFVNEDGRLLRADIHPNDRTVFEPLLSLVASLGFSTPPVEPPEVEVEPLPTSLGNPVVTSSSGGKTISVRGVDIYLPPGVGLGSAILTCVEGSACDESPQIISRGDSFIAFYDTGVAGWHFLPGDETDFQPILDALGAVQWAPLD
jgi:hypothetical protein